jgi:hypothetical protein
LARTIGTYKGSAIECVGFVFENVDGVCVPRAEKKSQTRHKLGDGTLADLEQKKMSAKHGVACGCFWFCVTVKCLIYGTAQVEEQAGVGQSHVGNRSLGQK